MKLAFIIYSWFPHGGQQRDLMRLAEECKARGHEVEVHTMRWLGHLPQDTHVNLIPARGFGRLARYRRFTRQVGDALADSPADLVVGFNKMPLLDVYFAADPCFAEKARTQRGAYYRFTPRFRHFSAYEQSVFGEGSKTEVLVLSERQRDEYIAHYPGCAGRLHLLPPGLSEDRRAAARDPDTRRRCREELGIAGNEKLILQIGSGFRIKGGDRSLRALASLPEPLMGKCRYVLAGKDRPGRFLALARKLGIRDRVRILPGQDNVARLYQAADLLLHPAYAESAGYVLLEATVAGLPVLTTSTCGYAGHIAAADSGQVCGEPFSQLELNRRLLEMLQQLDSAPWSENGLRYGRNVELYNMSRVAVDFLEQQAAANP